jgi:hypothetical protein
MFEKEHRPRLKPPPTSEKEMSALRRPARRASGELQSPRGVDAEGQADDIGARIGRDLDSLGPLSSGPLPGSVREVGERHLGVSLEETHLDFGKTGEQRADNMNALAVTEGARISFAGGRVPSRQTLGHELTHVAQQSAWREQGPVAQAQKKSTDKTIGPLAGAPSDWEKRVNEATDPASRASLVSEATRMEIRDVTASAKGARGDNGERLAAGPGYVVYDPAAPVINYDDNLNDRRGVTFETIAGKKKYKELTRNAGYTAMFEGRQYVVLGPLALKSSDPSHTSFILQHELDHAQDELSGVGERSELEAWTRSFARDFHHRYELLKRAGPKCYVNFVPEYRVLHEEYEKATEEGQALTVKRLTEYYRTIEGHAAHRQVFQYWVGLEKKKKWKLAFALDKALGLRADLDRKRFSREIDCAGLESASYESQPPPSPARARTAPPGFEAESRAQGGDGGDGSLTLRLGGGAALGDAAHGVALQIGAQYELASLRLWLFHPVLGAHVLYLPPSGNRAAHIASALTEVSLRLGKPSQGFYFDLTGGVGLGLQTGAPPEGVGVEGALGAGVGYRWQSVEVGATARQVWGPGDGVVILGVGGLHF